VARRSLFGDVASLFNRSPVSTAPSRRSVFGDTSNRGIKAQLQAYGQVSTLYTVVSKIANSCSDVQWHLYRKKIDGRKRTAPNEIDRTEIVAHPALDLWSKPNDFFTQPMFVETVTQHQDLTGEQWWVIAFIGGTKIPGEIWPVSPDRMEPVPDPEKFIRGHLYTGPGGEKVSLEPEEVVFIKAPNPADPYRGLGPVEALMVDLDAERSTAEWNRQFFRNSAEPGGVLEVPGTLNDQEYNRLNAQWEENHRGVGNAHRVAILEAGTQWKSTVVSQRDMQFEQLRRLSTEKIMEAFAMHGHLLGKSADINRANADAAESTFARWILNPRLNRIKHALNTQLLPRYGAMASNIEFDYEDPSLEDQEAENARLTSRAQAAATLLGAGFDPAEVLQTVGLPEMKMAPPKPVPPALAPFQGGAVEEDTEDAA
jgi:HK97 family phage portal protein